jgi:lysine 2,3-aminomutase
MTSTYLEIMKTSQSYLHKKNLNWKEVLRQGVDTPEALAKLLPVDKDALRSVVEAYPLRINAYFLDLMLKAGEPLIRQVVPDPQELEDAVGLVDPLAEEANSPVPNLTHRYPDRVLFTVTNECAVYCRFCTRKRKVGKGKAVSVREIENGIRYIRETPRVRDVLVSGGDPFMLSDDRIEWILRKIMEIPHVETIRIGTRIPSALPSRVTTSLARILKKIRPLYINVHFNHPAEITEDSEKACLGLVDSGAVLGNQTVLLRGINDDAAVLTSLFRKLIRMRVRPYYLLQGDLTRGTEHFRTRIDTGLCIMEKLRGHVSGLAVPTYVIDLPNGGGKVPIVPNYMIEKSEAELVVKNYLGKEYRYPQPVY